VLADGDADGVNDEVAEAEKLIVDEKLIVGELEEVMDGVVEGNET